MLESIKATQWTTTRALKDLVMVIYDHSVMKWADAEHRCGRLCRMKDLERELSNSNLKRYQQNHSIGSGIQLLQNGSRRTAALDPYGRQTLITFPYSYILTWAGRSPFTIVASSTPGFRGNIRRLDLTHSIPSACSIWCASRQMRLSDAWWASYSRTICLSDVEKHKACEFHLRSNMTRVIENALQVRFVELRRQQCLVDWIREEYLIPRGDQSMSSLQRPLLALAFKDKAGACCTIRRCFHESFELHSWVAQVIILLGNVSMSTTNRVICLNQAHVFSLGKSLTLKSFMTYDMSNPHDLKLSQDSRNRKPPCSNLDHWYHRQKQCYREWWCLLRC